MTTPIKKLMLAMAAAFALCLGARAANEGKTWLVVDLRTGALSYYGYDLATATNTFNTAEYKTEKMVFRRIPAGLYWVRDGAARAFMENDYYMAMFTVTVGQYAIITNSAAVVDQNDAENLKPKMDITWQQWEGTSNLGYYFPNKASTGPIGQLEQRIHGNAPDTQEWLSMDLPTISMWEVAARAMPANDGSHKSWRWFFGATSDDIDLYAWRYDSTEWYATYKPVGSFLPNDWGFYDIIGNGGQLCLDGIADWPAGDEIYHYSQHPCRRAYSRGAAPYGWMSFWELKEDGERVLHEWDDDEAWGYRYSCGGSISDSADLGFFQRLSVVTACSSSDARRGARLAIVCRNEVSAPPVTVTWQDDDGNVIEADAVPFGTMPSYGGATPTKPSTVYGTYEFTGWTPQIGLAVSNTTYTAKFDSHTIYYAIKWLNWDGTELYADSHWYGYSPGYYGATPTKPPTVEYEYTFTGWNPEPAAVTGETTYVAQFMQSARKYDITWLNYDGSTNATSLTPYNTIPEYAGETPAKPSTVQYAYTFAGWTPELEPATSNIAYTAMFDESIREYPVNFYNNTGSELLFTTNVPYGSTPEYLGETPTNPSTAQYHYSFAGWGRDMMVVDGPSFYNDYYAEFDPILRSYDITWLNYDGTVLCVTNMPYGATPAYNGATPTKPKTDTTRFAFSGWTQAVVPVTGAATYMATFEERAYPIDLSTLTGIFTVIDGDKLIGATTYAVSIAADATVTLAGMASPGLTCLGNATIVIADATTNTLNGTLRAGGPGTTLTINGNTGTLTVTGDNYSAGIGAFNSVACGSVVINGGNIVASGGGNYGTGIGAAKSAGCDGVAINGGSVVAIGAWAASGIGGNGYYGPCGNITIAATITRVEATRGGSYSPGKPINSNDNVIIADGVLRSGDDDANTWTLTPVDRSLPIDISSFNATFIALDGDKLIGTAAYPISIADGATVTLSGMSSSGLKCLGNATIVIADATANTLNGTLRAGGPGTTLTINGNTGTLTVTGDNYSAGIGAFNSVACGSVVINGGNIVASGGGTYGTGIGAAKSAGCDGVTINGGSVVATGMWAASGIGGNGYYGPCGNITIAATITRVEATRGGAYSPGKPINSNDNVIIADGVLRSGGDDANTWILEPDVKETAVTVGGTAVGEVVRGEDGKTLSFAVAAGTVAGDVKLDIGGVDVTKGFRVTVNGTEATAVLLAPYEVPKEAGAADEIWTENGDGTVTLNVTVVPGLYYAADSAESLDALACPGASAPATGATTLTAPKPVGDKGFFKVWVSDAPIPATP